MRRLRDPFGGKMLLFWTLLIVAAWTVSVSCRSAQSPLKLEALTGPLTPGHIESVAVTADARLAFAVVGGRVFRSSVDAGTWKELSPVPRKAREEGSLAVAIAGSALFAGSMGGLRRLVLPGDGTWEQVAGPPDEQGQLELFASDGGSLFAVYNGQNIHKIWKQTSDRRWRLLKQVARSRGAVLAVGDQDLFFRNDRSSYRASNRPLGSEAENISLSQVRHATLDPTDPVANRQVRFLAELARKIPGRTITAYARASDLELVGTTSGLFVSEKGAQFIAATIPHNGEVDLTGIFTAGGQIFANSESGFYRTQDEGKSWTRVEFGFELPTSQEKVASVVRSGGVFLAAIGAAGTSWPVHAELPRPGDLLISFDGGKWEHVGRCDCVKPELLAGNNTLYILCPEGPGLFEISDMNQLQKGRAPVSEVFSFSRTVQVGFGDPASATLARVTAGAVLGDTLFVATADPVKGRKGVYRRGTQTDAWINLGFPSEREVRRLLPAGDSLVAITDCDNALVLAHATTATKWKAVPLSAQCAYLQDVWMDPFDSKVVYAVTLDKFFWSDDGGMHLNSASGTEVEFPFSRIVQMDDSKTRYIFGVKGGQGQLYRIDDSIPRNAWWRSLRLRAILLSFLIAFVAWQVARFHGGSRIRSWIAGFLEAAALISPLYPSDWLRQQIDVGWLSGALLAQLVVTVVISPFVPRVFRELGQIAPLDVAILLALRWGWVRRRIYAGFIHEMDERLNALRIEAQNEKYMDLPAKLRTVAGAGGDAPTETEVSAPAAEIITILTKTVAAEPSGLILIEAEGGVGKSALLREVAQRLLETFKGSGKVPLPVPCDGKGPSVKELVLRALGRHVILPDSLRAQLELGHFLLVIDNLHESAELLNNGPVPSKDGETLEMFIRSSPGQRTPIIAAGRPAQNVQRITRLSSRWVHVQPQRLTDGNVDTFLTHYKPEVTLPADLKSACRGPDGTYLPVLLRMALLVPDAILACEGGPGPDAAAQIYEFAFRRLLGAHAGPADDNVLARAARLCVDTYWQTATRHLAYRNAPDHQKTVLRILKDAHIVVAAEPPPRSAPSLIQETEPAEVRFFHDSMQSFLTALGLFQAGNWAAFPRAASDPGFAVAQDGARYRSELFQMILNVFRPQERVVKTLSAILKEWGKDHYDRLALRDILDACPTKFESEVGPDLTPAKLLHLTLSYYDHDLELLGRFFSSMAARCYPSFVSSSSQTQAQAPPGGASQS